MSYLGPVDFPASSGDSYRFHAYTDDHVFDDVGAVYIFTRKEDVYYRLYIGRTDELGRRIRYHEKWPCVRQHNVNSICVFYEEMKCQRLLGPEFRKVKTSFVSQIRQVSDTLTLSEGVFDDTPV